MTTAPLLTHAALDEAISRACARIAPTWPLDRFIAVNPLWGLIDLPLPVAAAELQASSGSRFLMPRAWYREAWRAGRFTEAHLAAALEDAGSTSSPARLRALLELDEAPVPRRARVVDLVDAGRDPGHELLWRDFVTHSVSQVCAAFFDEGQADFGPDRADGLYACWRRHALADRGPELLMGARAYRDDIAQLPLTARETIASALSDLEVAPHELERYLWGLLLDQNGWASWCAYRRWTARQGGSDDDALVELLAVRLAWEWYFLRAGPRALRSRWQLAMASWPEIDRRARDTQADDWVLQHAVELAWQEQVVRALPAGLSAERPSAPAVQAVFCIDVRSEVIRRALEATSGAVQTLGFAGFFGLPVDYLPLGTSGARPQLPALIAPRLRVTEVGPGDTVAARRAGRLARGRSWRAFKGGASSTFTFVEALGLGAAVDLLAESLGRASPERGASAGLSSGEVADLRPRLTHTVGGQPLALEARCELAAGVLRAMSLTRGFARLVLLAGHGSQTRNNPHAAGLDCGACGGQTGEVSARAAAALLNDAEVRSGLATRGLEVPASTHFLAGLHDTTTDDVTLFDLDEVPASHTAEVATLRAWLAEAGARARQERAPKLGLEAGVDVDQAIRRRARDWAQVRPEWGLANNACLIVGPREQSRHLSLEGRAFLHEYRFEEDPGFSVLESIMTAPMVVAHWINAQYFASTVDPQRYGSGNKLLHNVVGGRVGVFEGNGGDLRIGLPLQSLHDGRQWVHTPLRLTVFIAAPRDAIEAIIRRQPTVRALVDHGWLFLAQLDVTARAVFAYRDGAWVRRAVADA